MTQEERKQEFQSIYFNDLGLCGCGRPEDIQKLLYLLLDNHNKHKLKQITYDEKEEILNKILKETDPDVLFEFIFHILDNGGLLEHGGSIYGSWFTDKGKRFLDYLSDQELLDNVNSI